MSAKKTPEKKKNESDKNLSKNIKELKKELKEKEEKLLRNIADFENYQKRMEKEIKLQVEETKKKYLTELLDLYVLLKKAYDDKQPKEGLKLLLNNVENFFEKEQIRYI